jgi:hypothetical protein
VIAESLEILPGGVYVTEKGYNNPLIDSGHPVAFGMNVFVAMDETTMIGYSAGDDELQAWRFNGTQWAEIATLGGLTNFLRVARLNASLVLAHDTSTGSLQAYTWNGSDTIAATGSALAIGATGTGSNSVQINPNTVAVIKTNANEVVTVEWTGSALQKINTDFSRTMSNSAALPLLENKVYDFATKTVLTLSAGGVWSESAFESGIDSTYTECRPIGRGSKWFVAAKNNLDANILMLRWNGSGVGAASFAGLNAVEELNETYWPVSDTIWGIAYGGNIYPAYPNAQKISRPIA